MAKKKSKERAALEAQAVDLGVEFAPNLGDEKLAERVADAEAARAKDAGAAGSGDATAMPGTPGSPEAGALDAPADNTNAQGEQTSPQVAPAQAGAEAPADHTTQSERDEAGAAQAGAAPAAAGLLVEVVGPKTGFRRCGRRFGPDPVLIPLEALSETEKERLASEPKLSVTTREAPAAETD